MKRAIVITGPTASGKSALAVSVATMLGTEIISADSRQIYRGIPIVTAVPDAEERRGITHHLVETLPLEAYYSAAAFEEDALRIAAEVWQSHDTVIVCGGSMMYVDAFCNGIDPLPTVSPQLREALADEYRLKGDDWLRQRLKELDAEYYDRVDLKNTKRVMHAVEVSLMAGKPYSSLLGAERTPRDFKIEKYYIDMPRPLLFDRINARVDKMILDGLEEEARRVYPLRHLNSLNTVGLKEMFAWFDGKMERQEAIERIKKNTRVYAKKQMTWFARDTSLIRLSDPAELLDSLS